MTTELCRPISISKVGPKGFSTVVRATLEECAAVAVRMKLLAIQSLECSFTLTSQPDGVSFSAQGCLRAWMTRVCVASAEEFETGIEDEFTVQFVPCGKECYNIDPERSDEIPYDDNIIDLGETACEQLGLVLDPYPRMPNAIVPTVENDEGSPLLSTLARTYAPGRARQ